MPLYGRSFTLLDPSVSDPGSPAKQGPRGPHTNEAGYASYYEVCEYLQAGATRHYIAEQKVPYLVQGTQWLGYDDPASLTVKVEWMRNSGYGGIMVWALDLDDFKGVYCGQGKYPLLTAINNACFTNSPTIAPTVAPTNGPTDAPTSPPTNGPTNPATTAVTVPPPTASTNAPPTGNQCQRRVCYYTNWAQYRGAEADKYFPEDINVTLCTHIMFSFAKLQVGLSLIIL